MSALSWSHVLLAFGGDGVFNQGLSRAGCSGLWPLPSARTPEACQAACSVDMPCLAWQWTPEGSSGFCRTGIPLNSCSSGMPIPDVKAWGWMLRTGQVVGGLRRRGDTDIVFCVDEPGRVHAVEHAVAILNRAAGMYRGHKKPLLGLGRMFAYYLMPPGVKSGCEIAGKAGHLYGRLGKCMNVLEPGLCAGDAMRAIMMTAKTFFAKTELDAVVRPSATAIATTTAAEGNTLMLALVITDSDSFDLQINLLRELGFKAHRIPPVQAEPSGLDCSAFGPPPPGRNPKETACFIAHRNALVVAAASPLPSLVLERDWSIGNQSPATIRDRIAVAALSGDVLRYLGNCFFGLCAHAYLIHPRTAQALLLDVVHPCNYGLPFDYLLAQQVSFIRDAYLK